MRAQDLMATTPAGDDHGRMSDDHDGILDPDPMYDAPYLVLVYAAWVSTTWAFGDTVGLAVLVLATLVLTVIAGRRPVTRAPNRSFASDFATVLLFCGAGLGAGVFIVEAVAADARLTIGVALIAIAAGLVVDILRPTAPSPTAAATS